jgi:hypothetical protein
MKTILKKIIRFSTFFSLFISFSCEGDKHSNKNDKPKTVKTTNKLNKWNINSICECYDEAIVRLETASKIRNSYKNFDDYNQNKVDVKKVKTETNEFRSIQNYCLQRYKRAMFENNCDTEDNLKNIQDKLFESGIQISKH